MYEITMKETGFSQSEGQVTFTVIMVDLVLW